MGTVKEPEIAGPAEMRQSLGKDRAGGSRSTYAHRVFSILPGLAASHHISMVVTAT